ncbi:oligosaccharide flippase family protein [Winogradskyella sp. SM1960]|uniref:oligosaccharide flippase family protein n=1 Tax=Winogradskyella sp. SM1960 TaxID=2865955 RepID=UPI001CD309DB|nr:oligosaccharide flippase family protein [Winogradskyella sp. SM1960]
MKDTNNTIQAFWVIIGSLSAFAFTIVSSMILSRYFDKTDYGTYKQIMYTYNTLLTVFTLGLPRAYSYFLPRVSNSEAKDIISKINYILIGSGVIMSLTIFLGADLIAVFLKNEELGSPLRWFSLVPLFMLPTMGLEGILATYKKTKILAFYNISTKVLMLLCVVVPIIIFNGNVKDAVIGFTIASFISFVIALYLKNLPVRNEVKSKSSYTFKDIFKYSTPIMMAGIWGVLILSSDQFFISRYFGTEVFADFANGSLQLPFVGMIVSATSIVLAPLYSKLAFNNTAESKEDIIRIWKSVFEKTIKMIYPLVVFFFCFADIIMVVLYGGKYENSGDYFKIKLIVNFFTLISYGPLVLSIGGHKYYYKVHMYGAFILISLEFLAVKYIDSPLAIVWISVICQIGRIFAMLYFIANFLGLKLIKLFPFKLIVNLLFPAFLILYGVRFVLIQLLNLNDVLLLISSSVFYAIFFGAWVYYKKISYYSIFKPLISKISKK